MSMRYVSTQYLQIVLILSSILIGCQKANFSADLPAANGRFATVTNEYPAVVMVVAPGGNGICTGTFVSERAVLTAAHCTLSAGTYTVVSSFGNFQTSQRLNFGPGVVNDPNDISLLIFNSDVADRSQGQVYDFADDVREGDTLRLVGFGCNSLVTRRGSGVKRTATNVVADIGDYIEFVTNVEDVADGAAARGILGPDNRGASCFGDSGGPAMAYIGGEYKIAAVTHAGGQTSSQLISEYVNVADRSDNRDFIRNANSDYDLGIRI